jgi:hypothetical protein
MPALGFLFSRGASPRVGEGWVLGLSIFVKNNKHVIPNEVRAVMNSSSIPARLVSEPTASNFRAAPYFFSLSKQSLQIPPTSVRDTVT